MFITIPNVPLLSTNIIIGFTDALTRGKRFMKHYKLGSQNKYKRNNSVHKIILEPNFENKNHIY